MKICAMSYAWHNFYYFLLISKCSFNIRSINLFNKLDARLANDPINSSQCSSNIPTLTILWELNVISLTNFWYFLTSFSYSLNEWSSFKNESISSSAFLVIKLVYLSKDLEWFIGPLLSALITSATLFLWASTILDKITGISPPLASFFKPGCCLIVK